MTELATLPDTFSLIRALEEAGALTPTSLDLSSQPDLPFNAYESLGAMLGKINSGSRFWLGDWLRFGEATYGDNYVQAAEATGLAPQSLANIQSVCHRVPPKLRNPKLSFSAHAEVAALEPAEQKRWLKVAEDEDLRTHELRERIRCEKVPGDVLPRAVSKDDAAAAVWHSSKRVVGDHFLVPADPMLTLRDAFDL